MFFIAHEKGNCDPSLIQAVDLSFDKGAGGITSSKNEYLHEFYRISCYPSFLSNKKHHMGVPATKEKRSPGTKPYNEVAKAVKEKSM